LQSTGLKPLSMKTGRMYTPILILQSIKNNRLYLTLKNLHEKTTGTVFIIKVDSCQTVVILIITVGVVWASYLLDLKSPMLPILSALIKLFGASNGWWDLEWFPFTVLNSSLCWNENKSICFKTLISCVLIYGFRSTHWLLQTYD
jgi:hypothetical protein